MINNQANESATIGGLGLISDPLHTPLWAAADHNPPEISRQKKIDVAINNKGIFSIKRIVFPSRSV